MTTIAALPGAICRNGFNRSCKSTFAIVVIVERARGTPATSSVSTCNSPQLSLWLVKKKKGTDWCQSNCGLGPRAASRDSPGVIICQPIIPTVTTADHMFIGIAAARAVRGSD